MLNNDKTYPHLLQPVHTRGTLSVSTQDSRNADRPQPYLTIYPQSLHLISAIIIVVYGFLSC